MNCQQAEQLFNAYLDGDLAALLRDELDAHRLHCTECRQELALLEVAGHVIASDVKSAPAALSSDFTNRLIACVEKPQPQTVQRFRYPRWLYIGGSLAAAACILMAFTVFFGGPEPQVAGVKITNPNPIVADDESLVKELDSAADSIVDRVESTWTTRAESAHSLIEFSQMSLLQILDQFDVEEKASRTDVFESLPESFDELAPTNSDDIEDL